MAVRLLSQVLGVGAVGPLTQITLQPLTPGNPNTHSLITSSSSVAAALQAILGSNANVYIATTPAEIAAIEAAVSITPIDAGD